ncbi:MAG: response regulator [Verrucomicrobia bacterium]|nr:response regulator [Cytophagales bacterium]
MATQSNSTEITPYVRNIMLIDDDFATNYVNEIFLKKTGWVENIIKHTQALKALEDLLSRCVQGKNAFPELILLDLNMPVMNGFEFLEAFNQLPELVNMESRIYIASSSDYPRDLEKAWQLGIYGFVLKPIGFDRSREILLEIKP